ncbi:MAG TPA: urea transporter [Acidimicrobiales bacterium]|nr:urea transporter [Acidimicrobiales bacterium]
MTAASSSPWTDAVADNGAVRFVDTVLRGAGQVMFQDNPLTGLLFLAGITWGAIDAGMAEVAVAAVVGLVVATVTAILLDVDRQGLRQGMYGFNGILVGVGAATFLHVDGHVWAYIVVGAAVSTVVMLALANVLKTWGVPALTFPFVLTTWFLVLGAWAFANVEPAGLGPARLPVAPGVGAADVDLTVSFVAETLFRNVSQVFLINNVATGVIFVVALAVSSRWSAVFAVAGSALALATALVVGAEGTSITSGLFGFSAVLTAIALGSVFYTPGGRVAAFAALGVVFTVVVQGALDAALSPVGIPTFTAPFVVATWLFLLPKERFVPVHHAPIAGGALAPSPSAGPGSDASPDAAAHQEVPA